MNLTPADLDRLETLGRSRPTMESVNEYEATLFRVAPALIAMAREHIAKLDAAEKLVAKWRSEQLMMRGAMLGHAGTVDFSDEISELGMCADELAAALKGNGQ